jgi:hypothetical protein
LPRNGVGMINRRRRIDLGSVALTATLFSIYAGARSSARALGVARALLP